MLNKFETFKNIFLDCVKSHEYTFMATEEQNN